MGKYFSFTKFGNPLYTLAKKDHKFGLTSRTARILIIFQRFLEYCDTTINNYPKNDSGNLQICKFIFRLNIILSVHLPHWLNTCSHITIIKFTVCKCVPALEVILKV